MENPEISGKEVEWNCSFRWKFSGKKEYLSRYYLFPIFTETTEIFCTICLNYLVPGFMLRESEKFTGSLKMVQLNPVLVFVAKKYTSTI